MGVTSPMHFTRVITSIIPAALRCACVRLSVKPFHVQMRVLAFDRPPSPKFNQCVNVGTSHADGTKNTHTLSNRICSWARDYRSSTVGTHTHTHADASARAYYTLCGARYGVCKYGEAMLFGQHNKWVWNYHINNMWGGNAIDNTYLFYQYAVSLCWWAKCQSQCCVDLVCDTVTFTRWHQHQNWMRLALAKGINNI